MQPFRFLISRGSRSADGRAMCRALSTGDHTRISRGIRFILDPHRIVCLLLAGALTVLSGCGDPLSNRLFEEDVLFLAALPPGELYLDAPEDNGASSASSIVMQEEPSLAQGDKGDSFSRHSGGASWQSGSALWQKRGAASSGGTGAGCVNKMEASGGCDSDWLRTMTAETTKNLNGLITDILVLLDDIREYPPTERTEDSRVWGPWEVGSPSFYIRLEVFREAPLFRYELTLSTDPERDGDVVLDGQYLPGSTAAEGEGSFTFSFTVQALYFPDQTLRGSMDVSYTTVGDGIEVDASLFDIVDVNSGLEPVDEQYAYETPGDGSGKFYVDFEVDVYGDSGAKEQVVIWSGWEPDWRGRSDVRFYGGDLGGSVGGGVECWNSEQEPVYFYAPGCTDDMGEGDPAQCIESSVGWNEPK